MKRANILLLVSLAAGFAQVAGAINYLPTHLLLVFRAPGYNNVICDLGSVSNYLGLAVGTRVPVPYDGTTVSNNFNNSLTGVKFAVLGATSTGDSLLRVWQTDQVLTTTPTDVTYSRWSTLRGKIDNVGSQAATYTLSAPVPFVVDPAQPNSYDSLVAGPGLPVNTLGGDSPFVVEAGAPTTQKFYELQPNGTSQAATLLGAFTLDVNGNLFFTAGALPPLPHSQITAVAPAGNNHSISFTTTNGVNYKLQYSTGLNGGWATLPGLISGDGSVKTVNDNTPAPARFYRIQSSY